MHGHQKTCTSVSYGHTKYIFIFRHSNSILFAGTLIRYSQYRQKENIDKIDATDTNLAPFSNKRSPISQKMRKKFHLYSPFHFQIFVWIWALSVCHFSRYFFFLCLTTSTISFLIEGKQRCYFCEILFLIFSGKSFECL